jgi:hypothetical protein
MTTKKIPINEGSVKQLRYHAETVLGLELAAVGLNRGQIIAKIEAAAPGTTEITVEAEQDSPAQAQAEQNTASAAAAASVAKVVEAEKTVDRLAGMSAKQAAQHHNDPTIEIRIPKSNEAGGDRDVPVSVNGMQWLIQREKWIKVPYRVFVALQHAEETKYDHTNNDIGQMQVTERLVPSYFFQTQNGPSQVEIDAWIERTQAVELA